MNLPPDYHTHNYLCRHAEGKLTEYAKAALQIGVAEIGFSDHAPMEQDPFDSWRMLRTELPCYLQMLEQARTEYPQLTIRAGLEVDYIPGMESWIKELAGLYDWDYFIGSVHYLDNGWDIDNPEKIFYNDTVNQSKTAVRAVGGIPIKYRNAEVEEYAAI